MSICYLILKILGSQRDNGNEYIGQNFPKRELKGKKTNVSAEMRKS